MEQLPRGPGRGGIYQAVNFIISPAPRFALPNPPPEGEGECGTAVNSNIKEALINWTSVIPAKTGIQYLIDS